MECASRFFGFALRCAQGQAQNKACAFDGGSLAAALQKSSSERFCRIEEGERLQKVLALWRVGTYI